MCAKHNSGTTTANNDHKHNPSASCCASKKITSIKPLTAQDGCCTTDTDGSTSCSVEEDNGESDPKRSQITDVAFSRSWIVNGMDCPSCARKIEKAVSAVAGVAEVKVLFATEKLVVSSNSESVFTQVENKVKETGFTLRASNKKTTETEPSFIKKNLNFIILFSLLIMSLIIKQTNEALGELAFTISAIFGLFPISYKAYRLAKNGSPFSIETLMSVAAIGAIYLGETVEAAMVILLFMLGEQLEAYASSRARSGVKALMALVPEQATVISSNGKRKAVDASELSKGDVVEVAPGSRLPADGLLTSEYADIDESALTGESVPVSKRAGAKLMAGTVVSDRVITFEVTSKQGENSIDRILHLIEEAESRKAPLERFLDKFSRWYTPAMMLFALLVIVIPPLMFAEQWDTWIYRGLTLLLIACPCALVISTPAAITSGLAAAAKHGALIKGGAALEQLGRVTVVAFDKTGTLTKGKPELTDIIVTNSSAVATKNRLLEIAASVEAGSSHPLAKAVVNKAIEQGIVFTEAEQRKALVGRGVSGVYQQQLVSILAPKHSNIELELSLSQQIEALESQGKTVVVVTLEQDIIGILAWRDELREDAAQAVNELKLLGVRSVMLTGDNQRAAKAIADEIGIEFRAELLPIDKVTEIEKESEQYDVAMVGDGINDAPAMKSALIGIAMGGGTDVALETADAALTHNRVAELPTMIALSRSTLRIIRQNITLALGLKAVFLVTTLLGITGLWVAVLADSGATALVTLNALRLLRFKAKTNSVNQHQVQTLPVS